jgi:serine/threonine-protein kinase
MGTVYKAEQTLIRRVVALKVLRREVVQDETAVRRFLNEARAISSLSSPHTVRLFDFGVTKDGLLYYTMELLQGRSLRAVIEHDAPMNYVRASLLMEQACLSLEEAHGAGILHRDIKPDNLFSITRNGDEELKVLDFGIAKLSTDEAQESLTRTGAVVGTPAYLSPEQAQGNPVVPASDLYSLGIVFYEMLAGIPPFRYQTPMKTILAHIRESALSVSECNPGVQIPVGLEEFLATTLEKDPERRFQTAKEFRQTLHKVVKEATRFVGSVPLPSLSATDQGVRLKALAWTDLSTRVQVLPTAEEDLVALQNSGEQDLDPVPRTPTQKPISAVAMTDLMSLETITGNDAEGWTVGVEGGGRQSPVSPDAANEPDMVFHTGRSPVARVIVVLVMVLAGLGAWFLWPKAKGERQPDPAVNVVVSAGSTVDVQGSTPPGGTSADVMADVVAAAEPTAVPDVLDRADARASAEVLTDQMNLLEASSSEVSLSALDVTPMSPEAVNTPEVVRGLDVPVEAMSDVHRDVSTPSSSDVSANTAKRGRKEGRERPRHAPREKEASSRENKEPSAAGFLKRGREAMTLGRLEDAVALLKKAVDAGEDRAAAEALIETCRQRMVQRDYERHLSLGDRAMEEKRWEDCLTQFHQALKLRGSNPEIERKMKKCREMSMF